VRVFSVPLVGYGLAIVSLGAASVVVAIDLFSRSGSPGWAAVGAASRALPYVLGAPIGALVSERRNPRRVLLWASAAQVLMAVLLLLTVGRAPLLVVAAIGFVANLAWSPSYATMAALVGRTVDSQDLAAASALFATTESIAFSVGPGLGGLIVSLGSLRLAAAVALVAAVVAVGILALPGADRIRSPEAQDEREPMLKRFAAGLSAIKSDAAVAGPLSLELVTMLLLGASQVLLLVAATEVLDMGDGGFGTLNAALSMGAFLALFVAARATRSLNPGIALLVFTALGGVTFGLLAAGPPVPLAIGLLLLCGVGLTTSEVLAITMLQRNLPESVLTRVFGVVDSLTVGAILVGAAVAPLIVGILGIEWAIVAFGLLAPVVALASRRSLQVRTALAAASLEELRPLADLLGGLPFLSAAARPAVEAMAARGVRGLVGRGQVVVQQGDAADDFYAIVSGSFDVVKTQLDGAPVVVATLGPGQGFGEIGLLQRVPRTATVVATSDAELLRVPGDLLVRSVGTGSVTGGFGPTAAIKDRFTAG
jgi:MFS family permease